MNLFELKVANKSATAYQAANFLWILLSLEELVNVMEYQVNEAYSGLDFTKISYKIARLSTVYKENVM
jgi:hypothetical protein